MQRIAPSATLAISAKARELQAAGKPVIGFGVGEPDFPTPPHIVAAAQAAAADPHSHHYTAVAGLGELRAAIAADRGDGTDPAHVVVSNGAKQAAYLACAALLDPGSEVLLPAPYWGSYAEMIRLAGAEPVPVFAGAEHGFKVSPDLLEAATTSQTKMLLFTSPHNPTGAVYDEAETKALGAWAAERELWVLCDEIYRRLTYPPAQFSSLPQLVPGPDRFIVVDGVAKSYAMTGWRVGWLIGPPAVVTAASSLQSHMSSNVSNVSQYAALAALRGPQESVAEMREAFDRRRRKMSELLQAIPGVDLVTPAGAFYAFPSLHRFIGGEGARAKSTLELAEIVLEAVGVAFVPGEAFAAPGYGRFSFALADDELVAGLERFAAFLGGE